MTKVAVLLSTYNGSRFIAEFLDSLCQQDFKNFDLIVRDDLSSDSTLSILNDYKGRLSIIRMPAQENLGPAKSFIGLLEYADFGYDVFMFADQDDFWYPNKISRCVSSIINLDGKNEPILYCSALELVDEGLRHIKYSFQPKICAKINSLVENVATGCTIGVNCLARDFVLKSLPSNYIMHDWWMYLVVSFFGHVSYDSEPTIKYRQHSSNTVGGATSFFDDYKRRLLRFFKGSKSGVFSISDQASTFLETFGKALSERDCNLVRLLSKRKKGPLIYMYLFFFSPFRRQRLLDGFILRFLFLIGRY